MFSTPVCFVLSFVCSFVRSVECEKKMHEKGGKYGLVWGCLEPKTGTKKGPGLAEIGFNHHRVSRDQCDAIRYMPLPLWKKT